MLALTFSGSLLEPAPEPWLFPFLARVPCLEWRGHRWQAGQVAGLGAVRPPEHPASLAVPEYDF